MDMSQTASLPAGRVHVAPGPDPLDVSARALLLRVLEMEERQIREQRRALEARAREIGQLLAMLRAG